MEYEESLKRPKILIVDDSPVYIQFIASVLKRGKYVVRHLTDGRQIFEVLEKGIPDLILLDIVMPGVNGFDVCRMLKENENYNAITVIFLSALDDTDSIVKGFAVGAQDYMSKPVNPEVLLARVKTHIELKMRTDRLNEAYKEIESFRISHDLKAPLWDIQKIAKYMECAVASNKRDEEKELLEALNEKAGDAVMLIDKLLQLTRVSNTPLNVEAVDMKKLTEEVYNELIINYPNREIKFKYSPLPIVLGDRLLLRQVLVNILSNAMKYTRDRNPAIISMKCHRTAMEHVFSLSDNGVGFDMKYSGKLFGMFQRLHSQEEFDGTGTGLAIVKKIISRHSGRIWMEAETNKGAVLSFTLPLRVS